MKTLATVLLTGVIYAHPQPASACHKYSHWYYPYPQRCGIYARASAPLPVLRSSVYPPTRVGSDIPLPDLSAAWDNDDHSEGMQRLKALRLLTQEGK